MHAGTVLDATPALRCFATPRQVQTHRLCAAAGSLQTSAYASLPPLPLLASVWLCGAKWEMLTVVCRYEDTSLVTLHCRAREAARSWLIH
jgi:hypothetical protein